MGFMEFLGEKYNPGEIGDFTPHDQDRKRPLKFIIPTGILSIFLIGFLPLTMILEGWYHNPHFLRDVTILILVEAYYLFAAYNIKPRPAKSNLGWVKGLIDNPFRISDDTNRGILFMMIFLLPGRLLGIGAVDFIKVLWSCRPNAGQPDHTQQQPSPETQKGSRAIRTKSSLKNRHRS